MIYPDEKKFLELTAQGNLIPVGREVPVGEETPVSAYIKLSGQPGGGAFLLESAETGGRLGRYSFVGARPTAVMEFRNGRVRLTQLNGEVKEKAPEHPDPLHEVQELLAGIRVVPAWPGDRPPFAGGAVGFLAFEAVRFFETTVGMAQKDDLGVPDACFALVEEFVIFDHAHKTMRPVVQVKVGSDPRADYQRGLERLAALEKRLALSAGKSSTEVPRRPEGDLLMGATPNMSKAEYVKMAEDMQEHIRAGDIFQVVPSQRFTVPFRGRPIDLYRALRAINPSPYMFCLEMAGLALVGSSPETHVRCENGKVEIRPIAGTRPRGKTPEEDLGYEKEMKADPKERAEHIMLVDLARNDLGRVCEYQSVKVVELMEVERFSHVMHLVSRVTGQLKPGQDAYQVMRATFPAGTVSGSPKVRALQILAQGEPTRRGAYAGAAGYFSFDGNLDSCISIRTILLKSGKAHVQAGGGLVADSTPEGEYQESVNKAKAGLAAVAAARTLA
ncbi:anthranilate synthase component I [bacterium]|nr:anthranilate synthase component I [bacterium]